MKKAVMLLAMLFVSFTVNAEPVGYPGSAWGVLTAPAGTVVEEETDNVLFQGNIEQGIDWFRFGVNDKWTFNTFANVGFSADANELEYNNKIVPGIGAKLVRDFNGGVAEVGVRAYHEQHFTTGENGSSVQAYASFWRGWNLK